MRHIECGRDIDPFTLLAFQIREKVFTYILGEIIYNKGVHLLHVVGRAIFADGVDIDFILMSFCQVRMDVVLTCFKSKIFDVSMLNSAINHELWIDDVQLNLEKYDTTCYAPISNFISIHKLLIAGLKGCVACSFHVIFEDEVDGAAELTNLDLVFVDEAEAPR